MVVERGAAMWAPISVVSLLPAGTRRRSRCHPAARLSAATRTPNGHPLEVRRRGACRGHPVRDVVGAGAVCDAERPGERPSRGARRSAASPDRPRHPRAPGPGGSPRPRVPRNRREHRPGPRGAHRMPPVRAARCRARAGRLPWRPRGAAPHPGEERSGRLRAGDDGAAACGATCPRPLRAEAGEGPRSPASPEAAAWVAASPKPAPCPPCRR